ncbi:MAG: hypothetical protein QXL31_05915 [Thermosphaera sp.]
MGLIDVPKTSSHMIFSFVATSTLAKLSSLPPVHVLLLGAAAAVLDQIIDLGHEGGRRSGLTHSIASIPALLALASLIASSAPEWGPAAWLARCFWLMLLAALGHLLWDSLTVNGVHIPLIGWVSLASLDSQGAAANLPPILAAMLAVYLFWMPQPLPA